MFLSIISGVAVAAGLACWQLLLQSRWCQRATNAARLLIWSAGAAGLKSQVEVLFPRVCVEEALKVVAVIDRLLVELLAALQPQDLLIVVSPCGDAHR